MTICLFINVAPSGKSELTWAGTCATGMRWGTCLTGVQSQSETSGTRWQDQAHTSQRFVVRDGRIKLTRARSFTKGTRWSCDERGSSGQLQDLRACYLRKQNLGIWEYHIQEQHTVVRRGLEEEILSGQNQGRYWIIWPKAAGLYTHRSWKSNISRTYRRCERLSDESIWELSWSFGRLQVGTIVSDIPKRRRKGCLIYKVNRWSWVGPLMEAWQSQGSLVYRRKYWSPCWREYRREWTR